jgi:hypothetical protein
VGLYGEAVSAGCNVRDVEIALRSYIERGGKGPAVASADVMMMGGGDGRLATASVGSAEVREMVREMGQRSSSSDGQDESDDHEAGELLAGLSEVGRSVLRGTPGREAIASRISTAVVGTPGTAQRVPRALPMTPGASLAQQARTPRFTPRSVVRIATPGGSSLRQRPARMVSFQRSDHSPEAVGSVTSFAIARKTPGRVLAAASRVAGAATPESDADASPVSRASAGSKRMPAVTPVRRCARHGAGRNAEPSLGELLEETDFNFVPNRALADQHRALGADAETGDPDMADSSDGIINDDDSGSGIDNSGSDNSNCDNTNNDSDNNTNNHNNNNNNNESYDDVGPVEVDLMQYLNASLAESDGGMHSGESALTLGCNHGDGDENHFDDGSLDASGAGDAPPSSPGVVFRAPPRPKHTPGRTGIRSGPQRVATPKAAANRGPWIDSPEA